MTDAETGGLTEQMYCSQQINVPLNLPYILKQYAKAAIRTQPSDLLYWSAVYFRALADGTTLPVKERIEYPPITTPSGLSPGFLKVLIKQFGQKGIVFETELIQRWLGVGLQRSALDDICRLAGNEKEQVRWLNFVAVAAGTLCPSLTQTMILICELLTDDPEGGPAAIHLDVFLPLYKYLSRLNCGPVTPNELRDNAIDEICETQQDSLTSVKATEDPRLIEEIKESFEKLPGVDDERNPGSDAGLQVWEDVEPLPVKLKSPRPSVEGVTSEGGLAIFEHVQEDKITPGYTEPSESPKELKKPKPVTEPSSLPSPTQRRKSGRFSLISAAEGIEMPRGHMSTGEIQIATLVGQYKEEDKLEKEESDDDDEKEEEEEEEEGEEEEEEEGEEEEEEEKLKNVDAKPKKTSKSGSPSLRLSKEEEKRSSAATVETKRSSTKTEENLTEEQKVYNELTARIEEEKKQRAEEKAENKRKREEEKAEKRRLKEEIKAAARRERQDAKKKRQQQKMKKADESGEGSGEEEEEEEEDENGDEDNIDIEDEILIEDDLDDESSTASSSISVDPDLEVVSSSGVLYEDEVWEEIEVEEEILDDEERKIIRIVKKTVKKTIPKKPSPLETEVRLSEIEQEASKVKEIEDAETSQDEMQENDSEAGLRGRHRDEVRVSGVINLCAEETEIESVLSEPPQSLTYSNIHIPGIGPVVPERQIKAVVAYMIEWSQKQSGFVMPRNIRHFMCPPIDIECKDDEEEVSVMSENVTKEVA